ncbi:MAG: hypothetical protein JWR19_1990 [Pedosphaera sp.]|nr:hypothetical protein [Pedosphaera sp.]
MFAWSYEYRWNVTRFMSTAKKSSILIAVVLCGIALLIPAVKRYRTTQVDTSFQPCLLNLLVINVAKKQWALENKKSTIDVPIWNDLLPYLGSNPSIPKCPNGGTYTIGRIGELPTCSLGHSNINGTLHYIH